MKFKVVVFEENRPPRILIYPDLESIPSNFGEGSKVLVNPPLGRVRGLSPEFWALNEAAEIVPQDSEKVKKILETINVKSTIAVLDHKSRGQITDLIGLPSYLDEKFDATHVLLQENTHLLSESLADFEMSIVQRLSLMTVDLNEAIMDVQMNAARVEELSNAKIKASNSKNFWHWLILLLVQLVVLFFVIKFHYV
jgi:hypothetical protein